MKAPHNKVMNTLPMHLGLALTNWLICGNALAQPSAKSSGWKPSSNASKTTQNPKPKAQQKSPQKHPQKNPLPNALAPDELLKLWPNLLQKNLQQNPERNPRHASAPSNAADIYSLFQHPDFVQALSAEAYRRAFAMLQGVQTYQSMPANGNEHAPTAHRVIWRKANAELYDYGGEKDAPAILCIPSLINRHHILDLYPKRSMVKFLRDQGYRVLLLNWNTPSVRERRYDCADYVRYLLLDALDNVRAQHDGALHLLGYCMGGVFALAAAQLRPLDVDGLMLLATPWDFAAAPALPDEDWNKFEQFLMQQETIPPLITETLFHLLDPWRFQEKFARFSTMKPAEQKHFAAVEQWVNDGVPLSRYVARNCYIDWPRDNALHTGLWQVGGDAISPHAIQCPALVVTPTRDKIVPLSHSKRIFENCLLKVISSGDHVIPINNRPDYFKFIEEALREFGI